MEKVWEVQYGNCYNSADISGNGYSVGGICGDIILGTIQDCKNDGNVTGSYRTGGICGWAERENKIKNCSNSGNISEASIGPLKRSGLFWWNCWIPSAKLKY